jgi:hypothetical protein
MGWRERDYAKFTDEERRRLYGSGSVSHRGSERVSKGAALAVACSVALFFLGQLPHSHPVVPALHFRLPYVDKDTSARTQPPARIDQTSPIRVGSTFTIRGTVPNDVAGVVKLRAKWRTGHWQTLAISHPSRGNYILRAKLIKKGDVQLRVRTANRTLAVGTLQVRS